MPNFKYPVEIPGEGKLTQEQIMFLIAQCMADEMEASYRYMAIAARTDDEMLKGLLAEISGDEYVHFGNFSFYLEKNFPDLHKKFLEGHTEAEVILKKYQKFVEKKDKLKEEDGDSNLDVEKDEEEKKENVKQDEIPDNIASSDIEKELKAHGRIGKKKVRVVKINS